MSDMDLQAHHELAWSRMPLEQRTQAAERLREIVAPKNLQELYEARNDPWFHFSSGMALRNLLRSDHGIEPKPKHPPILDAELPDMGDVYADQAVAEARNWDDYYVQVLEAAAGKRPLEDAHE